MDVNEFDPRRQLRSVLAFVALGCFFAPWGLIAAHPRQAGAWVGAIILWVLSVGLTVSVVSEEVPWTWLPPRSRRR